MKGCLYAYSVIPISICIHRKIRSKPERLIVNSGTEGSVQIFSTDNAIFKIKDIRSDVDWLKIPKPEDNFEKIGFQKFIYCVSKIGFSALGNIYITVQTREGLETLQIPVLKLSGGTSLN